MPIRINLLAEAQAAEEMRRRDPVKRATLVGICLVSAVLAWASTLQARVALQKNQVSNLEEQIENLKGEYEAVVASKNTLASARQKLKSLEQLHANRYLSGTLLEALQKVYLEDVRVVKLKTDFSYKLEAATPAKTNAFAVVPGKPATTTERIKIQIEAVDASGNPGDRVNEYKEAVTALPYVENLFAGQPREVRLTGLNPPQADAGGKPYVLFTLECPLPEKVR